MADWDVDSSSPSAPADDGWTVVPTQPQPNAAAQQPAAQGFLASMAPTDAEANMPQAAARLGPEVAEGAKRALGGLAQAGGAEIDAARKVMGMAPIDASGGVTAQENQRQQQAIAAHPDDPIFNAGSTMGQGLVSMAPGLGLEKGLAASTTFFGNIARQSSIGALQGFLAFSPDNQKMLDTAIGGGVPLAIAPVASAVPAALNLVRKSILTASDATASALASAKTVLGDKFPFTFAMQSGAPYARTLEGQSMNNTLQDVYRTIQQKFVAKFQSVMGLSADSATAPSIDDAFAAGLKQAQDGIAGLRKSASQAYDQGMAQAQKLSDTIQTGTTPAGPRGPMTFTQGGVPQTGSVGAWQTKPQGFTMPVQNFSQQLNVVEQQAKDAVANGGDNDEKLISFIDAVKGSATANGALAPMNAKSVAGTLRGLTHLMMNEDSPPTTVALAHKMMDAMNSDLDLIPQGSQEGSVVGQILQTRDAYKQALTNMETLRQSATYKMFGLGNGQTQTNPEQLLNIFNGFNASKQRQVVGWMNANSPELLQSMRRQVVSAAVGNSGLNTFSASNSDVSSSKLIDSLFKDGKLASSGLWNADQIKQMYAFRDGANIIENVAIPGTGRNISTPGAAEVAPNVISMNPIFIARQLARGLVGLKGADMLTDPQALQYFTQLRNTSGPKQAAARAALGAYISTNYGQGASNDGTQQQGGGTP